MEKVCTLCKISKPRSEYYENRISGGVQSRCKKCQHSLSNEAIKKQTKIKGSYKWFHVRIRRMRTRAAQRGIDFGLSVADLKKIHEAEVCKYCGKVYDVMSVDRVDSSKGYFPENCVLACLPCNSNKH